MTPTERYASITEAAARVLRRCYMLRYCAWCTTFLGLVECAPAQDGDITDGICRRCECDLLEKYRAEH